jgi:hypothetical protein
MKITKIFATAALIGLMTALGGCAARVGVPPPVLVSTPPPPPPAVVEVQPIVPFLGAVWIGGYYEYRHNNYHWRSGRYVRPPHRGARWVPGYWRHHRGGWGWHDGRWR